MSDPIVLEDILKEVLNIQYNSIDELQNILLSEKTLLAKILLYPITHLSQIQVDEVRIRFSGKKSPLQELLKSLRNLPADERKNAGALINNLKKYLEEEIESFTKKFQDFSEQEKLNQEKIKFANEMENERLKIEKQKNLAVEDRKRLLNLIDEKE